MLSLAQAMEPSREAHPQKVLFANKAWTLLTGYEQHEIEGHTLKKLQGPLTDAAIVQELVEKVSSEGFAEGEVVNYKKDGSPYSCSLAINPVKTTTYYGEDIVSHFVVTVKPMDDLSAYINSVESRLVNHSALQQSPSPVQSTSSSAVSGRAVQREGDNVTTEQLLQHLSRLMQQKKLL